ncbi:hypothetical protein [Aquidulcibacter sp.]|uniref:hypothetical protein n=1 Tax=Aquidulcibacter sp. TaxID=2052990 RepID=UPI0037C078F6
MSAKPPTTRHVLLALLYAPLVENILTTITVLCVNGLIVAGRKLRDRLMRKANEASYTKLNGFSFGLALIAVYLLAVSAHGYPTGVFAGFTFVAFVFLIFPDDPRSFSLAGLIGSCIVHFTNNCLSLTIGPIYLVFIQSLFGSR